MTTETPPMLLLYVGIAIGFGAAVLVLYRSKRRAELDALHAVRRHKAARREVRGRRRAAEFKTLWLSAEDLDDLR